MKAAERLRMLMKERGWTAYRMAKETGVPISTIRGILSHETEPSLRTLEILCEGLKISMAQFFDGQSSLGLTDEERSLLFRWSALDESSRRLVTELIEALACRKG